MERDATIETALKLFSGRRTAVGLEAGGADRLVDDSRDSFPLPPAHGESWDKRLIEHFVIGGQAAVGVYPMVPQGPRGGDHASAAAEWAVMWGCVDFDEGEDESFVHACNLSSALWVVAGIKGWIEKSRSKGYHVWVFAHDWTPAVTMRHALLAACELVEAPTREINPKQVDLPWDREVKTWRLGNYVRLPYPGGTIDGAHRRNVVSRDGQVYDFATFIEQAAQYRASPEQLDKMASKYIKPQPKPRHRGPINTDVPWRERVDPYTATMVFGPDGGPFPDQDRSSWLWKVACSLIERSALAEDEMLEALLYAHDTWVPDKFEDRAPYELERLLTKALEGFET